MAYLYIVGRLCISMGPQGRKSANVACASKALALVIARLYIHLEQIKQPSESYAISQLLYIKLFTFSHDTRKSKTWKQFRICPPLMAVHFSCFSEKRQPHQAIGHHSSYTCLKMGVLEVWQQQGSMERACWCRISSNTTLKSERCRCFHGLPLNILYCSLCLCFGTTCSPQFYSTPENKARTPAYI